MTNTLNAEDLHRLVKQLMDNGNASSLEEAKAMFRSYRLDITIDATEVKDAGHQAALLSAVALARRAFLGGVVVDGPLAAPLQIPLPLGHTLEEAVIGLGGSPGVGRPGTPTITIGGGPRARVSPFHVRTAFSGWRGGIVPVHQQPTLHRGTHMPLAPMLASALAVNEAFLWVQESGSAFGRRPVGLSLWDPSQHTNWLNDGGDEPDLQFLPNNLWLIGLGHLGQAYLWGLGLLPYTDPSQLSLVLQDVDEITGSTESTSILSDAKLIGMKKTRAMAAWCESRGFKTKIYERLFDSNYRRQDQEPTVALCGLDNAVGRRALDQVGFDLAIEAGLGSGYRDFRTLRLHTLPTSRTASEIWPDESIEGGIPNGPAYQRLLEEGKLDQCGMTLLAGKAVGAPFVGATAACLVLSEVLRQLHGGPVHQLIDLDLLSLEQRTVVTHTRDIGALNPGFVLV